MWTVEIKGWKKGCNTVAAIKLIREHGQIPLDKAHGIVNRVLAQETISVAVPTQDGATALIQELAAVGMTAELQNPSARG